MSQPRVKLSVGASKTAKALMAVISLVMIVIGAYLALVAYGLSLGGQTVVTSSLQDGQWHLDENGKLAPGPGKSDAVTATEMTMGVVGALCSLAFLVIALYLLLRVLRSGAWLEGSVLKVRGAIRTRKQDLARSRVGGDAKTQVITASDPDAGKRVALSIAGLPSDQLRMLANAITNQRSRSGPDDQAFGVAARLREVAKDPFS